MIERKLLLHIWQSRKKNLVQQSSYYYSFYRFASTASFPLHSNLLLSGFLCFPEANVCPSLVFTMTSPVLNDTFPFCSSEHDPPCRRRTVSSEFDCGSDFLDSPVICCSYYTLLSKRAACRSLSLDGPRRPPGPGESFLADAWWDVEADGWIDWPSLSAQALITTALEYTPLPRPWFLSPRLVLVVCLSALSHAFLFLSRCTERGWISRENKRAEWLTKICMVLRLHWKVEQGEDEAAY